MKMKTLQLKKAFAMLVGLLLSVAGVNHALAQDQIAVLQHEGVITTFYGGNAFVEAYNAADTSDVITLSSGDFNVCDINKPITIHGAGARQDTTSSERTPTCFSGSLTFNCGGSETEHLIMEGVCFTTQVCYFNLLYAEFYRCSFPGGIQCHYYWVSYSGYNYDGNMSCCKFINCRISYMSFTNSFNTRLINSVLFDTSSLSQSQFPNKNLLAYNSYIAYGDENPERSDFYNCVVGGRSGKVPQESCSFYNCVMAKNGYEGSLLEYAFNSNCIEMDELSQVFVDYTGNFNDELFILQDGITSSIQGTDGTEVGIYGGISPYYDRPNYMIMRHCTVGGRTTDDGHLSVDIEVVTEQ